MFPFSDDFIHFEFEKVFSCSNNKVLFTLLFISFSSIFSIFFSLSHPQIRRKHSRFLLHNMFPIFVRTQSVNSAQRNVETRKEFVEKTRFISFYSRSVTNTRCLDLGGYILTHHFDPARAAAAAWCCCLLSFLRLYCPLMCDRFLLLSHCHIAIIIVMVGRSQFNGAQYTVDRIREYYKSSKMHKIYFLLFSGG